MIIAIRFNVSSGILSTRHATPENTQSQYHDNGNNNVAGVGAQVKAQVKRDVGCHSKQPHSKKRISDFVLAMDAKYEQNPGCYVPVAV
jgi:hypothetical protein